MWTKTALQFQVIQHKKAIPGYEFVKTVVDENGHIQHIYKKTVTPTPVPNSTPTPEPQPTPQAKPKNLFFQKLVVKIQTSKSLV
mgnify:CR=1 FL=1